MEILLVEDDQDHAHFIEAALDKERYRVTRLTDGQRALDHLLHSDEIPDVVLLDYHLPFVDGLEVLKKVTASGRDMAFIFLTVDDSVDVAVRAMRAGALDFMPKTAKFQDGLPAMIDKVHAIHQDRVERKRAEAALRIERDNLSNILETLADGVCIVNRQYDVEYVNPVLKKEFGLPETKCYAYFYDRKEVCPWCKNEDVLAGRTVRWEWLSFKNQRAYEFMDTPLQNSDGSLSKLKIFRDITERVRAEKEIKTSLEEKKVLLQELYHRTMNNMQVICAILALQAGRINDEQVVRIFQETENRIRSMALVHKKLYQSKDLSSINFKEYVGDLANLLMSSYNVASNGIALTFDMDDVHVLIDTAVPCGLILNELISNALKHAFPGERAGEIKIQLHKTRRGEIELGVSDNGVGIPAGVDLGKSPTLGMETIFTIAEHQLQGQVQFQTRDGVACRIQFKDALYNARV